MENKGPHPIRFSTSSFKTYIYTNLIFLLGHTLLLNKMRRKICELWLNYTKVHTSHNSYFFKNKNYIFYLCVIVYHQQKMTIMHNC